MFYWNLGIQYYMSGKYNDAVKNFRLAIYGGMTPSGAMIEGIPISYNNRIPELYSMYGLVMARSGNCTEATEIVRQITQNIPDDAIAMANANTMTDRCKSNDFDIALASPVDDESVIALPMTDGEGTGSESEDANEYENETAESDAAAETSGG